MPPSPRPIPLQKNNENNSIQSKWSLFFTGQLFFDVVFLKKIYIYTQVGDGPVSGYKEHIYPILTHLY